MSGFAIFLVVGIAIAVFAIFGAIQERKRREAFVAMATQLGLRYHRKDRSLATRFGFLDKLRQGSNRYAYNILEGDFETHPVLAFDYHYETYSRDSKGRRQTHHHHFSFFILRQEQVFPELRIYPESFLARMGQALGFDDIDFESAEFSKAFTVRSPDKKFAYDICHTRMMRYLLEHPKLSVEIEDDCVAIGFNSRLDPSAIPGKLRQLIEIRSLFPEYLYQ